MIKKDSIKLNALLNMMKQCCAIIFPLITFPYISRVLGPESYGKYSYGNSIVSYFSLIAGLGISTYAIREGARVREEPDKINLFASQILTINLITTFASYILLAILLVFSKSLQEYISLIAIQSLIIICTTLGTDWVNSIYEDYLYITLRYVLMQTVSLCLLFLLVKKSDDYILYASIVVTASAGANIFNFFHVHQKMKFGLTRNPNFKVHLPPMLLLFCNSLAVTVYVNSDTTMLGYMKGDTEVGIYSVSTKIYQIIKQLLNAIVGVMLPRMSAYLSMGKETEYNELLNKAFAALTILLLPTITGVFMLARPIILIVGGERYLGGVVALRILCAALGFAVYGAFFANCVMLPNRMDKKYLTATLIAAGTNIFLNLFFIPRFGLNGAALTTVIAEGIVCTMTGIWSGGRFRLKNVANTILQVGIGCCVIVLICLIGLRLPFHYITCTVITIVLSVVLYGATLLLLRNEIAVNAIENLMKTKERNKGDK